MPRGKNTRRVTLFSPETFTPPQQEREQQVVQEPVDDAENDAVPGGIDPESVRGTAIEIYLRVPAYERYAEVLLQDENELERYIQRRAMVLMQMEGDQALLLPTSKDEMGAAIRARQNFIQRATELMQLIRDNRDRRIAEMELQLEMRARGDSETAGEMAGRVGVGEEVER